MLADRPSGVDQFMPLWYWIAFAVVVVLLLISVASWWGIFGAPRWVRGLARWLYRPKRRHRWYRRNQLRPARPVARCELDDVPVQLLPVGQPLAIEASPSSGPRPYRYASRAQHKEPLAEELTW